MKTKLYFTLLFLFISIVSTANVLNDNQDQHNIIGEFYWTGDTTSNISVKLEIKEDGEFVYKKHNSLLCLFEEECSGEWFITESTLYLRCKEPNQFDILASGYMSTRSMTFKIISDNTIMIDNILLKRIEDNSYVEDNVKFDFSIKNLNNQILEYSIIPCNSNISLVAKHVHIDSLILDSVIIYNGNNYILTKISYPTSFSSLNYIKIPHSVKEIGYAALMGSKISSIYLHDDITVIRELAFADCDSLQTIILPEKLQVINRFVFSNCKNIESFYIPSSVLTIKKGAFWSCSKLSSVYLPGNLESIEDGAFSRCEKLETIILDNPTPPHIQPDTFDEKNNITVYVPVESKYDYKAHPIWGKLKIEPLSNYVKGTP